MSEYSYNNYNQNPYNTGNQTMGSGYNNIHTPAPEQPQKKRKSSGKAARTAKRIGAITLSAVLFGGVAAGTFQGVNYLTGYTAVQAEADTSQSSSAESTTENTTVVQTTSASASDEMSVADIAEAVMPSIVSITNRSVQEVQNYFSMFGYYGGQPLEEETESVGSGIIIGQNDTELLIVTNNHVVEGADSLTVSFVDNQSYEANLKGTDSGNDLAVIVVPLENISSDTMSQIKVATLGDSDSLRVGEQVVAIGNALGYGQSVTTGIVSATNRTLTTADEDGSDSTTATYIQTDAAINPGNSGGALVNTYGQVIGINSQKIAATDYEGIGFAISINEAQPIINDLIQYGYVRGRVVMGITMQMIDQTYAAIYGYQPGIGVVSVEAGSPAEEAGLVAGDIITAIDGQSITTQEELNSLLEQYSPGDTITLTVYRQSVRGDGQELSMELTFAEAGAPSDTTTQQSSQQSTQQSQSQNESSTSPWSWMFQ